MKEFDTIVAISTGVIESGISIIRISGEKALPIIEKIFTGKNGRSIKDIKPYTLRYGHIIELKSKNIIDEVLVSYMKGPRSFTAENTIEINCHGGIISSKRILQEVIKAGARLAEPGEFTKRAFLNGRIDLSQAEAVMEIIRAKTDSAMKAAIVQSEGGISKEITSLREELLNIIAHIEATVDFPEEDLEESIAGDVKVQITDIIESIDQLLATADDGKIIRDGISVVIVGKPNVGKSSIMNLLLKENRSIVTDIPGTTRDVIEEYLNIDGIPVRLIDTAGIRETEDVIEKIGVEKTRSKIDEGDLIILTLDLSRNIDDEDKMIINYIKNKKYIVILNKTDLNKKLDLNELAELDQSHIINFSAKEGSGLDELKKELKSLFLSNSIEPTNLYITNVRHKEALLRAKENLEISLDTLKNTLAIDLASIDIKNAWINLGEITGETLNEDIINKIFSEFCLGK